MRRLQFIGSLVLFLLSMTANAQLQPDCKIYLIEEGRRVGEVFVPSRELSAAEYVEHWVLYPDYKYPGPSYMRRLTVQAVPEPSYRDLNDFIRTVPFRKGSKYIRVTAKESLITMPR